MKCIHCGSSNTEEVTQNLGCGEETFWYCRNCGDSFEEADVTHSSAPQTSKKAVRSS